MHHAFDMIVFVVPYNTVKEKEHIFILFSVQHSNLNFVVQIVLNIGSFNL
jgi:hypothetical protein